MDDYCTHIHWLYTVSNWLEYNILSSDNCLLSCQKCVICQAKTAWDYKKGAAKQSRINAGDPMLIAVDQKDRAL